MKRIFGSKRDEVAVEWRKLYNEELTDLNCPPTILRVIKSRRIRLFGHIEVIRREEEYTGFVTSKHDGKRPRRRPRRRWKDNIRMELQDVGYGVMDCSRWLKIRTSGGHL